MRSYQVPRISIWQRVYSRNNFFARGGH